MDPREEEHRVRAAGGVVTRPANGGHEFLLVHRPRYDDWSLPKGKLGPGEPFLEAAIREVTEESGVSPRVLGTIGTVSYVLPSGRSKIVRYWLMEDSGGAFEPNHEVDRIEWLDAAAAQARVSYDRDRLVLARGVEMVARPGAGQVHLFRHADAGDRLSWQGDDSARPLSPLGRAQADRMVRELTAWPINRILSSPAKRCTESVEALAATLQLGVEVTSELDEGAGEVALERLIKALGRDCVVLCSHGDVIGSYLDALRSGGVQMFGGNVAHKGSVWMLNTDGGATLRGRYVPPPGV